jgi:hypothetical protein
MDFDEKIISLYASCPPLFDKKCAEYSKNPLLKENMWKSIAAAMGVPGK